MNVEIVKKKTQQKTKVHSSPSAVRAMAASVLASGSGGAMIGGLFGVAGAAVGAAVGAIAAVTANLQDE